jgi:hypothetical protein
VRVHESTVHIAKAGGERVNYSGSHLSILRRVAGKWRLHQDQGSFDKPPTKL